MVGYGADAPRHDDPTGPRPRPGHDSGHRLRDTEIARQPDATDAFSSQSGDVFNDVPLPPATHSPPPPWLPPPPIATSPPTASARPSPEDQSMKHKSGAAGEPDPGSPVVEEDVALILELRCESSPHTCHCSYQFMRYIEKSPLFPIICRTLSSRIPKHRVLHMGMTCHRTAACWLHP